MDMVQILGLIVQFRGGTGGVVQVNKMEKDTTIANVVTMGAVGMSVMSTIQILTIISLMTAVGLNLILIYKQLKKKD
jgi:hypothetical protein